VEKLDKHHKEEDNKQATFLTDQSNKKLKLESHKMQQNNNFLII